MAMDEENKNEVKETTDKPRKGSRLKFIGVVGLAVLATVFGLALLVNIFQRKQEARNPFFRVVELTDDTVDPADRMSTRLNSSHSQISYAVFCLKKKK